MIMQDILQILPLLLVASLIGAFITWLYWRSRWKMVSEERNWYNQKLTETENQYNGLLTQVGQLEISNQDLVKNINASTAQNNNLATDLQAWQTRFSDLQNQSEEQRNRIAFLAPFETQTQTLTANLQTAEGKIGGLNADISALNALKAKLEAQIGNLNTQNTQLSANLQTAEGKIGGLNADIDALNKLKAQLEAQVTELEKHKTTLSSYLRQVQGQYNALLPQFEAAQNNALAQEGQLKAASAVEVGLTTQLSSWQNQYVEQTNAIASLKERIAELEALADKRADLNAMLQTDLNALKLQLDATSALNLANSDSASSNLSHIQEEYSTLEAMYEELQKEFEGRNGLITQLQGDLADCQNNKATPIVTTALTDTTNTETHPDWWRPTGAVVNPPAETTNSIIDFDRIGTASANEKDDLLIIKGIGPFIEGKLHALGIYTFRQIANFNADDITKVNEAIEVFAGRIERERWVDQARDFANNRDLKSEEDRLLSKRRLINFDRIGTATEDQKDDLAAMKGIGPMIERQLNQIGIYTFQQLANLNADDIEIISDAVVLYPGRVAREQWVEQAKERLNG